MFNELLIKNKEVYLFIVRKLAQQYEIYSISGSFFFLIQYSFLFSNNDTDTKTCTLKTTHFLYPQRNGENGARYLDPKYSRWISTDPALGEYIPAAGKANAKDMANLPGMGGVFNHINGNLFAYAANNPVRYIDPDGNFFGSFYANEKFKEKLNFYCNQYEKKLLALKNYNLQSDKIIIPANNTFELAVDCDSKQADNYIGNDVKQFAQKCLGYEKGSDSYNKYISDEKARYNRLQELRKSKNSDGSNNAHKVNNILDEASVIFKEEQKSAYKQGLSSTEINIRAEQKANDYIDAMLEKEGF